jgi:SHS2 domain-containing protein
MLSGYTILEHPADLGIEAKGITLHEAFEQAAIGMMSVILDLSGVDVQELQEVDLRASDIEQLLVQWLSEILYLYDGKKFVSKDFLIHTLTHSELKATIRGEPFSPARHQTKLDVKAITYHQLIVRENEQGGYVKVFLDI